MSFIATIQDLCDTLAADLSLQAYSQTKWGRTVTVRRIFKKRTEIPLDELPVILVVWGGVDEGGQEDVHHIGLFSGFYQDDHEKAQTENIEFNEYIRAAVTADRERNKLALYTRPKAVVTDVGMNHPTYWSSREVDIEVPAEDV